MPSIDQTLLQQCGAFEPLSSANLLARKLRILVVDDEPSIREILANLLRDDGHFVDTAVDGLDGLERFRRGAWDVVLTDRAMPGISGDQLATEIKIASPYLPIVMISGFTPPNADSEDTPRAVDMMVKKPFEIQKLKTLVLQAAELYPRTPDQAGEDEIRAVG
jgi:DNA-binding NtrC family response regulator